MVREILVMSEVCNATQSIEESWMVKFHDRVTTQRCEWAVPRHHVGPVNPHNFIGRFQRWGRLVQNFVKRFFKYK